MLLRALGLLALLYLAADLMDPSIRGVFFFESEQLFVDGVAQMKTAAAQNPRPEATPTVGDRARSDHQPLSAMLKRPVSHAGGAGYHPRRHLTLNRSQLPAAPSPAEDH